MVKVDFNVDVYKILRKYLSRGNAIEATKEIQMLLIKDFQCLKNNIIADFKDSCIIEDNFLNTELTVLKPDTILRISHKYDASDLLKYPLAEIEFNIPPEV